MRRPHRVAVPAAHHAVAVHAGEELVARSDVALALEESHFPPRIYIPRADVVAALEPSAKRTHCPFKGDATYWHVVAGGVRHEDAAWSYEAPDDAVGAIAGHCCFDLADDLVVTPA